MVHLGPSGAASRSTAGRGNFGRAGKNPVMAVFRLVRCCKKENDFLMPEFFYGATAEIDAF
jgi:hypothetical protein